MIWKKWWPVILLSFFTAIVYSNSLTGDFIFDDQWHINKPVLKSLWPPWKFLGLTGEQITRPTVYFSLAVNHAISGYQPWSYHLFNLIIHILNSTFLFQILRRTFLTSPLKKKYGRESKFLAFIFSIIWAIHPIQTQAVTYIIQRCESLMSSFFILTLYCAIRGWDTPQKTMWHSLSILFFFLGVGTKEVIVFAPLIVFLYRWIFFLQPIKKIILESKFLFAGFLVGYIFQFVFLAFLCYGVWQKAMGNSQAEYVINQTKVIVHYLKLVFWPKTLCFDYQGWPIVSFEELRPYFAFVSTLLVFSIFFSIRRKPIGFAGAWFFLPLLPTSIIPLSDPVFEHRMYLSSAAPIVLAGLFGIGIFRTLKLRVAFNPNLDNALGKLSFALLVMVVAILGYSTFQRNFDYATNSSIWEDTVKKNPGCWRGFMAKGIAFLSKGENSAAMDCFDKAIAISPKQFLIYKMYSVLLLRMGKYLEAEKYCRTALTLYFFNVAEKEIIDLSKVSRLPPLETIRHPYIRSWIQDYSNMVLLHGKILISQERLGHAVPIVQEALRVDPESMEAHEQMNIIFSKMKNNELNSRH